MKKNVRAKILLIVFVLINAISNAQCPTTPALSFNVFVNNGSTFRNSETEGPVAMGGDLTLAGNYSVATHNNFSYKAHNVNIGLLVGGKVNYNDGSSFQVLNNGYVKIGNQNASKTWYHDNNNASSPIRVTPANDYNSSSKILLSAHTEDLDEHLENNNPVFEGNLVDFESAFTSLKSIAINLSSYTVNADLTNPNGDFHSSSITSILNHTSGGQVKINLKSGNNILNVTGSELNSVQNFTYNNQPDANHVLIINVDAEGTFHWSAWTNGGFGGQSNCKYILYNFFNTNTLHIEGNGAIEGTVFAPNADINKSVNNSNIEGQVICKSYNQSGGGEIHSANFSSEIPGCNCTRPVVAAITGTTTICKNSTSTLNNATASGVWSTSDATVATVNSNGIITGVKEGTATISYSATNSCGTTSKTITITVNTTPTAPTITLIQPTCNVATGTVTVTAPTGSGISYSIDGINYQSGVTFAGLASGNYSVTAQNASGCISSVTNAVLNKPVKPSDWAYTNNYETTTQPLSGNSFSFVVYSNSASDTYNWNFGDGTTSTLANPTKSYTNFGIYNARLIATNVGGCSDTTYQTVVVTPASKLLDAIPACGSGAAPSTVTQTIIFPRSTTNWASANLKTKNAAKFDTTLGTLVAVKIINTGSFITNNKVEITGNMAAGTKSLVNIQVNGTMDFSAPGFLLGVTPPTIVDSFSSTGFDGIKDFAGTSGKNFGLHTSSMKDSTIFTAAEKMAFYQGPDSVTLTAYTNTKFSATFPTGNDSAVISTTAIDTATIIYYYCTAANNVSGGSGGGLESKSLGDAIVKRIYTKAFNSLQKPIDYNTLPSPSIKNNRATTMGFGSGSTLTLADILPQQLIKYNFKSYITTPTDIPSITNATDVLSIDYTLNNQAKAVAFGTQTSGAVYEHTKAICDRLKGSVLINIQNVLIDDVNMVTYILKTADGNTEYAMSFVIGEKNGRNNYTIQSNWLNQDYILEDKMFNIQLWAVSPEIVRDMAFNIISTLKENKPIQYLNGNKIPDTYITSGTRDKTNLELVVTNNQTYTSGYFLIEDKANEQTTNLNKRTIPFTVPSIGNAIINIPMSDIYESTVSMYLNNKLQDVVYMADGTWSYGAGTATTINSFKVINNTNKTYLTDELPVFRNVEITGSSADYVSIFKSMKGGGIAQNISAFKTLKFTATGGYQLRITLVKNSIANWNDQYNIIVPLDKDLKEYYVSLANFVSSSIKDKINATDISTLVFSVEVGSTQSSTINTSLSNISFAKQEAIYLQSLTAKEVQVYPNPSSGKFTCSFMSDKESLLNLKVIDVSTGRVVTTQPINAMSGINNITIDLNRNISSNSIYIVTLDGEKVKYKNAKLVVEK